MTGEPDSLARVLAEAGWTARQFGRAINDWLSRAGRPKDQIHPTTPYHWVGGACPHPPYPSVAALVLSEHLGRPIAPASLWPQLAGTASHTRAADHGLDGPRRAEEVLDAIEELAGAPGTGQLRFGAASGTSLVTAALDSVASAPVLMRPALQGDRLLPALVDLICDHTAALRRLDDRLGGCALSLRYVTSELRGVLGLLRCSTYPPALGTRLTRALADLAQLAGWMQFDAGSHGEAHRYFLLGLRASRAVGDDECAANMLGMLAYIASYTGQPAAAVRLAEAAGDLSRQAGPTTRARCAGRLATAYAAAGDLYGFRVASQNARELLERGRAQQRPAYLYYLSPAQLDAEAGQALVVLAAVDSARRRALLGEATALLTAITVAEPREDYQRSALLHGCYLAEAELARGEHEGAVAAARQVLRRLPSVQSRRCVARLRTLRRALSMRKRSPRVADFLPELDQALSGV